MKYKKIIIEEAEFELLKKMLDTVENHNDKIYHLSVKRLKSELESATIVPEQLMPNDVIRINSTVTIQMSSKVIRTFRLVVPEKSDLMKNKLSVLSPMGLALLGYATSDKIKWQFPTGVTTINILNVSYGLNRTKL